MMAVDRAQPRLFNLATVLIVMIMVMTAVMASKTMTWIAANAPARAMPALNSHAVDKHAEAVAIRQCLDKNGPFKTFKSNIKNNDVYYLTCQYEPGKFGFQICTNDGCTKTAFSPGNGTWQDIIKYLSNIATPFKGVLPWW